MIIFTLDLFRKGISTLFTNFTMDFSIKSFSTYLGWQRLHQTTYQLLPSCSRKRRGHNSRGCIGCKWKFWPGRLWQCCRCSYVESFARRQRKDTKTMEWECMDNDAKCSSSWPTKIMNRASPNLDIHVIHRSIFEWRCAGV